MTPDTCNTTAQPKVDPLVNATSVFELFAILLLMSGGQHIDAASNVSQKRNLTQTFNKVRQQMNVLVTVRGCAYKAWEGAVCCWNAPQRQGNKKLEWSWVCAQTHTWASLKFIGWLFPDKAVKKKISTDAYFYLSNSLIRLESLWHWVCTQTSHSLIDPENKSHFSPGLSNKSHLYESETAQQQQEKKRKKRKLTLQSLKCFKGISFPLIWRNEIQHFNVNYTVELIYRGKTAKNVLSRLLDGWAVERSGAKWESSRSVAQDRRAPVWGTLWLLPRSRV